MEHEHRPGEPVRLDGDEYKQDPTARWLVDCCGDAVVCSAEISPAVFYLRNGDPGYPAEYCDSAATAVIDGEPRCDRHIDHDNDYDPGYEDWDDD